MQNEFFTDLCYENSTYSRISLQRGTKLNMTLKNEKSVGGLKTVV